MRKVLLALLLSGVIYMFAYLYQDYLGLWYVTPLALILFIVAIVLWVKMRQYYNTTASLSSKLSFANEQVKYKNKTNRELEEEVDKLTTELQTTKVVLSKTENRLALLLEQDKSTIKLGDKVINQQTNRNGVVIQTKLDKGNILYRLSVQGKWYTNTEIRKID